MKIEVVYALSDQQILTTVELPIGATVLDAVNQSGLISQFNLWPACQLSLGIFGRKVNVDTILHEGDRVEMYRPLQIDPMAKRRIRAKKHQLS